METKMGCGSKEIPFGGQWRPEAPRRFQNKAAIWRQEARLSLGGYVFPTDTFVQPVLITADHRALSPFAWLAGIKEGRAKGMALPL